MRRNIGRLGSTYQKVASTCAAMRAGSPVSRQSQTIPSTDTSGSEATSAPNDGLRFASSETVTTSAAEIRVLASR